jgi:SAM-dependent methyltransferase
MTDAGKEFAVSLARTDRVELLDRADGPASRDELAVNLRDIRRANRYFGGTRAVLACLRPVLAELAAANPVAILDLATGSADIPIAIDDLARRRGWDARIVATDVQPEIVAAARERVGARPIDVQQVDARELPYPDGAFDVVLLSLALHHFAPDEALRVLREMRRAGRARLIVSDLERSRAGYAGAWLFGHLLTGNRMTRHDAPLSVQRAYTPEEALGLARAAGWRAPVVRRVVPFRYVLTDGPDA